MPKMLIIADDLTGALDTAAQFANESVAVQVSISAKCELADLFTRFDVVSVNANTRHEPAARAGEIVADLARRGRAAGAEFFYKKTDSTLRGNLGSELNALRIAAGHGRLAFAPASPALGRTTLDGHQFVFGQPLHETAYADDPRNPIPVSSIPHLLAQQVQVRVVVVRRNETEQAEKEFFRDQAIYVFDSETDVDLENVALCLTKVGLLTAVAAPAALARNFPHMFQLSRARQLPELSTGPMFAVVGSVNKVSQEQAAFASRHGFTAFLVSPEFLLCREESQLPQADDLVTQVAACLAAKKPVVLQTSRSAADVREVIETGAGLELTGEKLYERVSGNLARLVKRILDRTSVPVLTVFGGDTLLAIARACGWNGFYPYGELDSGIVHAETEPFGKTRVISKPGGFGGEEALWQIWKVIAAAE
jgi:uncharacterized protein YgbK (DUF1537 family)